MPTNSLYFISLLISANQFSSSLTSPDETSSRGHTMRGAGISVSVWLSAVVWGYHLRLLSPESQCPVWARRIIRRVKLFMALKGFGTFMYASNQLFASCQANTDKCSCQVASSLALMAVTYPTSFTSTNVNIRLRFDVHLTFTWHSPEPHLTTWPSSDLPLTPTSP